MLFLTYSKELYKVHSTDSWGRAVTSKMADALMFQLANQLSEVSMYVGLSIRL